MRDKLIILGLFAFSMPALAQRPVSFTFDGDATLPASYQGETRILEDGAYKGKALRLGADSKTAFRLSLQPSSTYRVTAWMRTESGADAMTMQTKDLGANNISVSTALAAWTKFEKEFHVSAGQSAATLEFSFGNSQGNTHAWVDEVTIHLCVSAFFSPV